MIPSEPLEKDRSTKATMIVVLVASAFVVSASLVYLWFEEVTVDTDGDGVPDARDPLPYGPVDGEHPYTFSVVLVYNGFGAACTSSDVQVGWEDIKVVLTDGSSNASWSDIDHSESSDSILDCGAEPVGSWEVTLLAWEMQMNTVLDEGDFLSFLFGEYPPDDVEFFVSIVYEPTDEVLAEFVLCSAL